MALRSLGRSGLAVSPIGFGAFKIGRNEGIKYPAGYELPDETATAQLLNGVLDLGINSIDTAPAYGFSEERIGRLLQHRRKEYVLSTKVGETFVDGKSTYDFSTAGITASVERSLQRLQTDAVDVLLLHSDGRDREILEDTPAVETLQRLKQRGLTRCIGLSGKTTAGAMSALAWADVLMVEYHLEDKSHADVISAARASGVGVVVKKGLAAGRLSADDAVRFVTGTPGVASLIVGSLNIAHLAANLATANAVGNP